MTPRDVTIIIPSYNTKEYTKMAYYSLVKYYPTVRVIILDDGSTDGSWEMISSWRCELDELRIWRNESGSILGHTITYDKGIEMAITPLVTIFHSDMICGKNYLENLIKHWKPKTVVCATRIEPEGIYPPGKEKILKPFGLLFNEFKEKEFDQFVEQEQKDSADKTTKGIFAPWLISKEDFKYVGGHDAERFAPYPEEDADLFLRFSLAGYDLIQSRDSFCYHWISRGHRSWAKNGVGNDDSMFKFYQYRARRNYLRKWHKWMSHDEYRMPITHPVYHTTFIINDADDINFIREIEPWANLSWFKGSDELVKKYIAIEQPTTKICLEDRMFPTPLDRSDVELEFSQKDFMIDFQGNMNIIQNLSTLLKDSAEPNCEMQLGIFKLTTHELKDYSHDLIRVVNP